MDKYTVILKIDEIRRLAENRQYEKAMKLLDTLDLNKIRIITDLSVFADVYEHNKRYDEAIQILLRIHNKAKTRRALFQLSKVYAKKRDFAMAEKYFKEFIEVAPKDSNQYILRYKIDKAAKKPLEELIKDLELFKKNEYVEEWAYELAKLYHKAGQREKCIKECSDIILWFGDGIIVEKATLLRAYYMGESEPIKTAEPSYQSAVQEDRAETTSMEETSIKEETVSWEEIMEETNDKETNDEEENDEEAVREEVKEETEAEETVLDDTAITGKTVGQEPPPTGSADYLKGILKNFMDISSIRPQLIAVFDKMSKEDNFKNIIITGNPCTGKTYLAKLLARTLYCLGYISTPKVAIITGERLNRIKLEEKQEKLMGGCVIIEKASEMSQKTVEDLISMMELYKKNIIVLLEGNELEMKQLVLESRKLSRYINYTIELLQYRTEELVGFAKNYLEEKDRVIDSNTEEELRGVVKRIEEQVAEGKKLRVLIKVLSNAWENTQHNEREKLIFNVEDILNGHNQ